MATAIPSIVIAGRRVGSDVPPLVIAEVGLNAAESIENTHALVEGAGDAGAHAIAIDAAGEPSQRFECDDQTARTIIRRAQRLGLRTIAVPCTERLVDVCEDAEVDAYKIANGDLTWDQLIARCATTGKPLILSTAMATLGEVHHALEVAREAGAQQIALLHAVFACPVPDGSANLRAIQTLAAECQVPVGFSDRGADTFACPMAVALGASLYERRLVARKDPASIDASISSTPSELAQAIDHARRAWIALGTGHKACISAEEPHLVTSRRSLCAARDLPAGSILTPEDLVALRPGTGYAPSILWAICGLPLTRPVLRGMPLTPEHLEPVRSIAEVA